MSYQAVKYVLQHSPIYGKARMVLFCLAEHATVDALSWPAGDLIARECRMRRSEVRDCLEVLLRAGEIVTIQSSAPRSSAKYLMLRFVETPDVGAPTVKIIRGGNEGAARDLTLPGMKMRVYSLPAGQIYREVIDPPVDTVGKETTSHLLQSERSSDQKSAQWERQGGPTAANSFPTEYSGTTNHQNHQGTVPAFQSGNGNHHSPAAAAPASSGGADGLATSPEKTNGWHGRYYDLLASGLDPAAASAKLREEGLLPPAVTSTMTPIAGQGSRDVQALHSMREIIEHSRRAAEGKEPFDFVEPGPQLVEGTSK